MSTDKSWTEYFRVVTPMLLTVGIFMLGNIISLTNKIDDKLFKHLTNDDMHVIRSTVVTKAEYDVMLKVNSDRYIRIENQLDNICILVRGQIK